VRGALRPRVGARCLQGCRCAVVSPDLCALGPRASRRTGPRLARGCGRRRLSRARLRDGRVGVARRADLSGRKEAQRVDVAIGIGSQANPEVDIRAVHLGRAARADRADRVLLGDRRALGDDDRFQVRERDRVAVGGLDRHRPAVCRHAAGEADSACCGRDHGLSRSVCADVDAAMLPRGVGVGFVVCERLHHRPLRGPAPAIRRRRPGQEDAEKKRQSSWCCQSEQQEA